MIKTILWDFDNTLLNFDVAEKAAIVSTFEKFNLGTCTNQMLRRYEKINKEYWHMIEDKKINKQTALVKRYEDFFIEYGIDKKIAKDFNDEYTKALGNTIEYVENSFELVSSLKGKYKQYIVSNGAKNVQTVRMKKSNFDKIVDGTFISDIVGAEKPSIEFFNHVFEKIKATDKSEIIIIGDSLSSDIKGGNNAGIKTCWYNPKKKGIPSGYLIDYNIQSLNEILSILNS
ncbi:MAG: YjjG family noncanonical pyrimidine nucleotidase [Lachnospiraceae bacterium]|nr:YjjG family noncanonical pyrimidine nucleotidase [Lachnospiraceae bacterium]